MILNGRRTVASDSGSGFSAVDVLIAATILLAGMVGVFGTLFSTTSLNSVIQERTLAASTAAELAEALYSATHAEVFATYNADPADDPSGSGTAVGEHFDVEGLAARDDDSDGHVGRVLFPTQVVGGDLQLREDITDSAMQMPRDLNGDGAIDDQDHALDYSLLPVRIQIEWEGTRGEGSLELNLFVVE